MAHWKKWKQMVVPIILLHCKQLMTCWTVERKKIVPVMLFSSLMAHLVYLVSLSVILTGMALFRQLTSRMLVISFILLVFRWMRQRMTIWKAWQVTQNIIEM